MNSDVKIQVEIPDDGRLVELGAKGDRDAFGQLVARYQSPVCALAYSSCGNIAQSEDLAQETFIIAWKKLGDLKEPAKFKAWLFGIARNLIHNAFRRQARNPLAAAEILDEGTATPIIVSNPAGQAISKEEEEILWRSIENIPETYREALVLFYREHQSIESVAATLEISEEAVRQRLSRGRKLLQEQVIAFVEGALRQTVPGSAFTLGVLAALPITFAASAKAATLAAAAKGGAVVVKGATLGSLLGIGLGPALGILLGYLGYRENKKNVYTPRERVFRNRFVRNVIIGAVIFCVSLVSLVTVPRPFLHWGSHPVIITMIGLGLTAAWCIFVSVAAWRYARASQKLREEEILAIGGMGFGLVGFGGFAIGLVALGGAAIGWIASGGIAVGWHAALGGMAIARDYALGGGAMAHHINDPAAREFFAHYHWLNILEPGPGCLFWLFAFGPGFLQMFLWRWFRRKMASRIVATGKIS